MNENLHTVCETHSFRRAANHAGLTREEVEDLVTYLAANPMAGNEMPGTCGCRKFRLAGRGKGKSGGYRTITFYSGPMIPVFLITIFSKGERADLSQKERNQLAAMTRDLVAEYSTRVIQGKIPS
jgi:hypothetical protein